MRELVSIPITFGSDQETCWVIKQLMYFNIKEIFDITIH